MEMQNLGGASPHTKKGRPRGAQEFPSGFGSSSRIFVVFVARTKRLRRLPCTGCGGGGKGDELGGAENTTARVLRLEDDCHPAAQQMLHNWHAIDSSCLFGAKHTIIWNGGKV